MSHWHRAPRAVSVRSLIQRYAKCIFLDRSVEVSASSVKTLSKEIHAIRELDPAEKLALFHVVRLCQEMHGVLVTADADVIPMLVAESGAPWGAIVLPDGEAAHADTIKRLATDQLLMRPSSDQEFIAEYVQQNRLLIDLRRSVPSIGIFRNCRWSQAKV